MIKLLLPCTSTDHDFSNLRTFVGIVDSMIVLDSGMTEQNIIDVLQIGIPTAFYSYEFDGDYSKMRNTLLGLVGNNCKVIMIDDSYSIEGITREDIINYDIIECSFKFRHQCGKIEDFSISPYRVIKIFRSDHGFYTRKHNEILNYREGTILRQGTIIDNYFQMRNKDIVPESRFKKACQLHSEKSKIFLDVELLEEIASGVNPEPHDQNDIDGYLARLILNGIEGDKAPTNTTEMLQ